MSNCYRRDGRRRTSAWSRNSSGRDRGAGISAVKREAVLRLCTFASVWCIKAGSQGLLSLISQTSSLLILCQLHFPRRNRWASKSHSCIADQSTGEPGKSNVTEVISLGIPSTFWGETMPAKDAPTPPQKNMAQSNQYLNVNVINSINALYVYTRFVWAFVMMKKND